MGRKNSKKKKQEKKQKHSHPRLLKGTLEITRAGMGFVTIEGMEVDIMIRPGDFNTALHGDTVLVAIKEQKSGGRRMQGVVKEVLQRKRSEFIGHIEITKAKPGEPVGRGFAFFIAAMDKPMPDIFIPWNKINGAKD